MQSASLEAAQRKAFSSQTSSFGGEKKESEAGTFYSAFALSYYSFYLSPSNNLLGVNQPGMWSRPPPLQAFREDREHSLCSAASLTIALLHALFCNSFKTLQS